MRYKQENNTVAGIVPGPAEPSGDINTYPEPLKQDLEKLWSGTVTHLHGMHYMYGMQGGGLLQLVSNTVI